MDFSLWKPVNLIKHLLPVDLSGRRWLLWFVVLLCAAFGRIDPLAADEELLKGTFTVSLVGDGDQQQWVVNALEQNIYNDLAGYARVIPAQKLPDESSLCPGRDVDCLLALYRDAEIDALMLGMVSDSEIKYETYDVANDIRVANGEIPVGSGSSLLKLRIGAFRAFRAFLEKGGILDDRQQSTGVNTDWGVGGNLSAHAANANRQLRIEVLYGLAGFTCLPFLLSLFSRAIFHPERRKMMTNGLYGFTLLSLALFAYQYHLETTTGGNAFNAFLELFGGYFWILAGLGGAVWGYFLIVVIRIILPRIQGIERIEQANLAPLLQSLLLVSVIKTAFFFGVFGLVFFGVVYFSLLFSVSQEATVVLLFPLAGLYVFIWMALMLDVFSMSIDVKIAGRKFNSGSEWNRKIRQYFIHYLKRNGVKMNREMVDDVVFVPGAHQGVICYRGGFSKPRIAINRDLLVLALGEIEKNEDEEDDAPDLEALNSEYVPPDLRQQSVLQIYANPDLSGRKKSMFGSLRDKRRARRLDAVLHYFNRDLHGAKKLSSPRSSSLAHGFVFPDLEATGDIPSLLSDDDEDLRIIQDVLAEYGPRAHVDHEADVDDADEHDMDFLFGAILHKFGSLLRHDDVFSTIKLNFTFKSKIRGAGYNFPIARHFAAVADSFVVFNFGMHHLMQYLYYRATKDPSQLTYKGAPGLMLKTQAEILARSKQLREARKPHWFRVDELERIAWLSSYGQESIASISAARFKEKRLFKLAFTTSVTAVLAWLSLNAFFYRPVYLDMIEKEQQEIAQAIEREKENERKESDEQQPL